MLSATKYWLESARYSQYTRYLIKYGGNTIPKHAFPEFMVAILQLGVPYFGLVTHSEEILTIPKSHKKNPEGLNIMRN